MLKKNDVVDIVSPGTACTLDEILQIKKFVEKIGLTPRIFLEKETSLQFNESHEFSSIKAQTRFEQLKNAIESKDSSIIWCTRGGYGSAEILPFLSAMRKPRKSKILIGFSDISAISIFLTQKWKWQVISAPMLIQLAQEKVSQASQKAIVDLIFSRSREFKFALKNLNNLKPKLISGLVVGGCISVISAHFGTENQINFKNKILFLEDEGEDGERLDRYFTQLVTIMKESRSYPKAIVLGNFLEANPHGTPKAKNIEIAIERFAAKLKNIPLFEEKSRVLGHSRNMMPLVLGAEAKITTDNSLVQKF